MAKNPNAPKKFRRKHLWWRYLLVFLGGFLFAGVGTATALAVGSACVPVQTVMDTLPNDVKQQYFKWLDSRDTVLTVVLKFVNQEITVDDILDSIEVRNIVPENVVGEKLHLKLCYYKTADTSVEDPEHPGWAPINLNQLIKSTIPGNDGTVNFVDNMMNNLVIGDVMDVEGTTFEALADTPIAEVPEAISTIKIKEFFPDAQGGLVAAVGELTFNDLSGDDVLEKIYVKDLLGVTGQTENNFMNAMCFNKKADNKAIIDYQNPRTVAQFTDLNGLFAELVIDDFVEIELDPASPNYNALLVAISGTPVGELATKLTSLKVGDIINTTDLTGVAKNVFTLLADTPLNGIANAFENLKIVDVLADEIYEDPDTKLVMKGVWKMMLYTDISTNQQNYETYTLSSFGQLIENMTNNMAVATLNDLQANGLIDVDASSLSASFGTKTLGEYTLAELIDAIAALSF